MATYYARKAGNINAADVWATAPAGTASNLFPTFTNADVLMANSFTITVNVSTTVAEVRNDTTGGATNGGTFTLGSGVLLKANVFAAYYANNSACLTSGASASIEGNITVTTSGNASSQLNRAVIFTGTTGTALNITGNIITPSGFTHVSIVDCQTSGGQLNITGNLLGNASSGSNAIAVNTAVSNTGALTITGNVMAGNALAISSNATNLPINITGTVTGGNTGVFGISNFSTSTCTIVGSAVGGVGGAGVSNSSTGTIRVTRSVGNAFGPGNTAGLAAAVGAANVGLGVIEIEQLEYGTNGMSPTSGTGIRLKKLGSNVAVFNFCDTAGAKTLIDATQNAAMPAASNVRSGVSYASGALTGSCAVPAAGSVALGVAVDNTTGTAVLTPEAVWGHASRTITGGLVDTATTLTNSPDVPTESEIASAVRTELDSNSTKLANLDASISSRLASADYTTPPTTAQISAAVEGSLLNEGDGQAVLNALVGAIGNQNVDEIALVAAIRSDLERSGGKLDSIPTAAAPSAASVATAVWSASTKEITGGTVDTLTNAPASVTPADIWDYNARTLTSASGPTAVEIRQEIDANSTKLDVAVGTRLAGSAYTAPANSDITAIKAKTDALPSDPADQSLLEAAIAGVAAPSAATVASAVRSELSTELAKVSALNTERLANVATTAIVGNLIAQANS